MRRAKGAGARSWSGRRGSLALTIVGIVLVSSTASAHVVFARSSLRQWLQHSASSLHAEILAGPETWVAPGARDRQEFFRVRVLEQIAGVPVEAQEIDFFPHAEGFPAFAPGQRVLLFLERTERHAEFAGLAARFAWFSVQAAGEEWQLEPSDDRTLALARDMTAWLEGGGSDLAQFAAWLEREFGSGDTRLQGDALQELIRARALTGLLDPEGVTRFARFVSDPTLGIARRAALLLVLAERPGFDATAAFNGLAEAASSPRERRTLVNQLGATAFPPVPAWLRRLSTDPDETVRRAVVEVQARRKGRADLALLERALADDSDAVARAAIRALGGVPGPRARALLEATAAGSEPERARWSAAELRRAAP